MKLEISEIGRDGDLRLEVPVKLGSDSDRATVYLNPKEPITDAAKQRPYVQQELRELAPFLRVPSFPKIGRVHNDFNDLVRLNTDVEFGSKSAMISLEGLPEELSIAGDEAIDLYVREKFEKLANQIL